LTGTARADKPKRTPRELPSPWGFDLRGTFDSYQLFITILYHTLPPFARGNINFTRATAFEISPRG